MKHHVFLYAKLVNNGLEVAHHRFTNAPYHMKEYVWLITISNWLLAIVFSKTFDESIKSVPRVYLRYAYQMYFISNCYWFMQWNAIKINAITNTNCSLSKNFLLICKRDNGIHIRSQLTTEHLIKNMFYPIFQRQCCKLTIIWISWYLHHRLDVICLQTLK